MEWQTRQPKHARHMPGGSPHNGICATTPRGEYFVHRISNNFVIYLDAIPMTTEIINNAIEAMKMAEKLDAELEKMGLEPTVS